jgi:alanine-synthesizing transaminase
MEFRQSSKLAGVCYEIRGPIIDQVHALEAAGHEILRLNVGNPGLFDFAVPDVILEAMTASLASSHPYTDSRGILSARRAVARYYSERAFQDVDERDVYLGNGVSELATMTVQALLDNGDEVLIPSPDYPLWTAVTRLAGGRPVHYYCDESLEWQPDIDDIAGRITARTKAIVVINPNNPTGAVYSKELLEGIGDLARRHNLMIFADEVYDRLLYDGLTHHHLGVLAPDVLCLTFSGLSKSHLIAGYRAGWLLVSGPRKHAQNYLEGLTMLAGMRLCPNVPAQYAIEPALGDHSFETLTRPGGRLEEQRTRAWRVLNELAGVSCVKPRGGLYVFPRIDPEVYPIHDDEKFVLEFLLREKVHIVQGTGFNWPAPDHVRIVTLPYADQLEEAIRRFGRFLSEF